MTNKPMLSVERKVIEDILADAREPGTDYMAARKVLRALLDKPVDERKPFAWYRVPKDFPLQGAFFPYIEGQSERDIQNSLDAEFGFYVKRLYDEPAAQHQGEPVYLVRDHGSCCWEEMSGESLELCQAQPAEYEVRKLYAEQPAPVSVADFYEAFRFSEIVTDDQAGELAEIAARLNGVKP